jgi:hypothetical protein
MSPKLQFRQEKIKYTSYLKLQTSEQNNPVLSQYSKSVLYKNKIHIILQATFIQLLMFHINNVKAFTQ